MLLVVLASVGLVSFAQSNVGQLAASAPTLANGIKPYIVTVNSSIGIFVPVGKEVNVQWYNSATGNAVGDTVALITVAQLQAFRLSMIGVIQSQSSGFVLFDTAHALT